MIRIPWHQTTLQRTCLFGARLLLLCLLTIFLLRPAYVVANSENIAGLQETIRALQRVYQQAGQDLQQQTYAGRLSSQEQSEYTSFIGYIGGRVVVYCRELYQMGGAESLADLSCPAGGGGIGSQPRPSTDEEIAALDASFAQSLGDFDEMLLAEEQKASTRQPRRSASGGPGGTGGQEGTEGDSSVQGDAAGGSQAGQGQRGDEDKEESASPSSQGSVGSGRGGGGSGQQGSTGEGDQDSLKTDDDIVARQLREAAEKETDPELKEKLWEEYRKYKAGK